MTRLVLAFPFYRQISVPFFFNWIQMDTSPVVGIVGTDGVILAKAMEQLVEMAFAKYGTGWDRLVVFEHDVIPPLNALSRIAQYGDERDIVGALTFRHERPHHVMAMKRAQQGYTPLEPEALRVMVENPGLYAVDAVAMGFTAIRRQVFEQWDSQVPMWTAAPPLIGHDLHFCNEAQQQGFTVWADSGLGCGHLTQTSIGYPDNRAALAEGDDRPVWF